MTIGVYGIFDSETNECLYVGESTQIEARWKTHITCLMNGSHSRKDFVEWFTSKNCNIAILRFEILEECEPKYLGDLECFYFDILNPRFFGQIPHLNRQWFHTQETKDRISKGLKDSIKAKKEMGVYTTVWDKMTPEAKAIKIARNKETGFNPITAAVNGRKGKGRPKSEEHKRKISEKLISLKLASTSSPRLSKENLEAFIKAAPTNITSIADYFEVSRPTVRKYLFKYELMELLESNRVTEYSKVNCSLCGGLTSKTVLKRHEKLCDGLGTRRVRALA